MRDPNLVERVGRAMRTGLMQKETMLGANEWMGVIWPIVLPALLESIEQAEESGLRAALEAVSYKGLLRGGKLWCDIDPDGLLRPEDVRTMCYDAIERLLEEAGKGRGGDG